MAVRRPRKRILDGPIDLPAFPSEADEAKFWETVDFTDEYLLHGPPVPEEELPPVRPRPEPPAPMTPDELRERRNHLGMTQLQLAEATGIPRATISRWELGVIPIGHGQLLRLALERLEELAKQRAS